MPKPLHLNGVILPETAPRDFWVADGHVVEGSIVAAEVLSKRCWVLPGLVDAHDHIGLGLGGWQPPEVALAQALADRDAGVLLIRDNGTPSDTRWIDEREDLPRIVRSGRHVARTKRYIKGLASEVEPEEFAAELERQAYAGTGWVKFVADWIDRDAGDLVSCWPTWAVAEGIRRCHALGVRVTAHTFGEQSVAELVDAGIDCVEHGTGLTDAVIEKMATQGTTLVPTITNLENFPIYAAQGAAKFPRYAAHMMELYRRHIETLGKCHDAGIPIYCGTDAGTVVPHGKAPSEIVKLAKLGSNEFALGAGSWAARTWLEHPNLEVGAPADFVVYDADPRVDLRVVEHPRFVVLRGAVVAQNGS
jgi:imidazolonepropionase-like amidohydrolase